MRSLVFGVLMFSWVNISVAYQALPIIQSAKDTCTVADIIIGQETAPNTVIEYSSLNCLGCAVFHRDVFPILQKKYVDTGKVRFIFRHFPLDEQAAQVAAVVSSAPQVKQLALIHRLFNQQPNWIRVKQPAQRLSTITGIPTKACLAAMNNKQLTDAVFQQRVDAEKQFRIDGTPTFIINGKVFEEEPKIENFEKAFNAKPPKTSGKI